MSENMKKFILALLLVLCVNACFTFIMLNASMGVVAIILGAVFGILTAILSYLVLVEKKSEK